MKRDNEYGNPNPKAPPELSQFAFIIRKWRCDVRLKGEDGRGNHTRQPSCHYILDGYVIAGF